VGEVTPPDLREQVAEIVADPNAYVAETRRLAVVSGALDRLRADLAAQTALTVQYPRLQVARADVAEVVAECDRLRTDLAREEREHARTIDQRDAYHEAADRLAYAVAPESVIGEHSSMNDPWANALEILEERADRDQLQAAVDGVRVLHRSDDHEYLPGCRECQPGTTWPCATAAALAPVLPEDGAR